MNVATVSPTRSMPDLADYMTTQEAATKLGFHVKSIRNMLAAEKLSGIKLGREWLVSKKSVAEYLKQSSGMDKHDPRRGN